MVSSTSIALKWLCGRSGESGKVSRCRHGVGCVVSLSLVWCCGCLCGSSGGLLVSGCAVVGLVVLCGSLGLWVRLVGCRAVVLSGVLWSGSLSGCLVLSLVVLSLLVFSGGVSGCLFWSGGVWSSGITKHMKRVPH